MFVIIRDRTRGFIEDRSLGRTGAFLGSCLFFC
jgi:hypothetical protein